MIIYILSYTLNDILFAKYTFFKYPKMKFKFYSKIVAVLTFDAIFTVLSSAFILVFPYITLTILFKSLLTFALQRFNFSYLDIIISFIFYILLNQPINLSSPFKNLIIKNLIM